MNRKLNFELLEQRNLFAMDSGSTESIASLDSHMTDVGLHGGERTDIADQDESLEPLPPKSLGGTARGTSPVHPFSGSNIQITAAFIADGSGNAQNVLLVGQQIFLRAEWQSLDLPNTNYTVGFFFDGVRVDSGTISGLAGSSTYWWYRNGSFASPGVHNFTIVIDPDNLISETNESDNSISFSATTSLPNNLPAKFIEPIGRPANQFWAVNNYADVDPRANSSTDYRNGLYQYDGHNARDSGPWGFSSQDQGIPIYAAADGVVDATSDGYFDRETTFGNRPANYVEIDHGNGFKTLYYHFATNTVVVKPGQVVLAGQLLAHMGSSGISTGTHLHYTPYYRNAPIEVGYAPAVYLASPLPYGGDVSKFFFETGISNNIQNNDLNDHISEINHFALNSGGLVGFWMETYNLRVGDILRWRYYSPGGTLASTNTYSIPQDYRFSIWWWNRLLTDFSTTPGTWTITMDINGTVQQSKSMLIDSTGEAAMRVTESSAGLINSGRTTPIDFGAVASGGSAVQRSFTIQNHGTTSLTLSNLRLPPGFSLVGSLPANTGVGSSSTLTISLDSTVVGAKFGSVTVDTNDGNTPQFWFNISGSVTGTPPTGRPTIAIVGPSTSLYGRSLPTIINPDATVTIPQGQSSPGFAGGQLKVEVDNAPTKNDWLSINRVYGNSGRIVDDIGTVTGGTKGRPLIVTFNNNADLASIQQLVRNIAYASLEPRYIYARKYIRFTLTDAVGLASNLAIAHIIPAAKDPFHHLYDEKSSNRNSTEITEVSRISSGPSTISTAMRSAAMESILAELETNHKSRRIVRSLRAQ